MIIYCFCSLLAAFSLLKLRFIIFWFTVSARGHRHTEDYFTGGLCRGRRSQSPERAEQRQKLQTAAVQKTSGPPQRGTYQGELLARIDTWMSHRHAFLLSFIYFFFFHFPYLGDPQALPVCDVCCGRCQRRVGCGVGETPWEEEKAEVSTKISPLSDLILKSSGGFNLFWNDPLSQTHGCAGTGGSVHHTGQQPLHHQPAEEPAGAVGQAAHLAAPLQQDRRSDHQPQRCCHRVFCWVGAAAETEEWESVVHFVDFSLW